MRSRPSAFTLIEVMVTLAVIGVAAGLGTFVMSEAIRTATARDAAFRFTEDARHLRADNIRQGLYTVITSTSNSTGTTVTYGGQHYGTATATPCEAFLAASVPPDVLVTKFYRELDVKLSQVGGPPGSLTNLCFTPGGQPYSNDLSTLMLGVQISIYDGVGGASPIPDHQLVVDGNGGMESTFDTSTKDGVANNNLYPYNDLGSTTPKPETLFAAEPLGPTYVTPTGSVIDPNAACGAAAPAGCGAAAPAGCGAAAPAGCGAAAPAGCGAAAPAGCGAAAPAGCGAAAPAGCGAAAPAGCGASCGAAAPAGCGAAAPAGCGAAAPAGCGAAAPAGCGAAAPAGCGACGGGCGCGGCGGCFTSGTIVMMSDGARPIEDVKVGDEAVAYDSSAGERGVFPVAAVFTRTVDELVILTVAGEPIETTNEHPFWVDGTGFTRAGDLAVGDMLVGLSGERRAVDRVDRLRGTFTVHNFHVEGAHTYFVTDMNLLVHNMSMLPY